MEAIVDAWAWSRRCVIAVGAVAMAARMAVIGARFRLEWRSQLTHWQTEAAHHVAQHMIGGETQASRRQFYGDMTVAQVIGGASERQRIIADRFHHRLGSGNDLDDAAVIAEESVATAQHRAALEKKSAGFAASEARAQAALATVLESQLEVGVRRCSRSGK